MGSLVALEGVRVLDLTHYIAGPYCTKLLAEYGAEVIKVERPEGEPSRRLPPFFQDDPHPEKSGVFLYLNTGKKSITLNLRTETGRHILRELIKQADLVVENFEPRVMPGWGFDFESLREMKPNLIMVSISNFGQSGPYRDFKATEMTLFAISGWMQLCGRADAKPLQCGVPLSQFAAGTLGAVGGLSALWGREATGGEHVDISIMEAMIVCLENLTSRYAYNRSTLTRIGRRLEPYPCNIMPAKGGYAFVFTASQKEWRVLCDLIGKPEFKDHPWFKDRATRSKHAREVDEILRPHFWQMTVQEIYQAGQQQGLGFGKVNSPEDLARWAHLKVRNWFQSINHPVVGTLTYPGLPFHILGAPEEVSGAAPLLGQHNTEVYGEWLGYTRQDLIRLRERGII